VCAIENGVCAIENGVCAIENGVCAIENGVCAICNCHHRIYTNSQKTVLWRIYYIMAL